MEMIDEELFLVKTQKVKIFLLNRVNCKFGNFFLVKLNGSENDKTEKSQILELYLNGMYIFLGTFEMNVECLPRREDCKVYLGHLFSQGKIRHLIGPPP